MQKALGAAKGQKAYLSMSQNTFTLSYESRPKKSTGEDISWQSMWWAFGWFHQTCVNRRHVMDHLIETVGSTHISGGVHCFDSERLEGSCEGWGLSWCDPTPQKPSEANRNQQSQVDQSWSKIPFAAGTQVSDCKQCSEMPNVWNSAGIRKFSESQDSQASRTLRGSMSSREWGLNMVWICLNHCVPDTSHCIESIEPVTWGNSIEDYSDHSTSFHHRPGSELNQWAISVHGWWSGTEKRCKVPGLVVNPQCNGRYFRAQVAIGDLGQEMSIEHHPHPTSPSSPVKTEEIWKIFVAKCLVSV